MRATVTAVAVSLESCRELAPVGDCLGNGKIARYRTKTCAVDANGIIAHVLVVVRHLYAVALDRDQIQAGKLLFPEIVKILRFFVRSESIDIHPRAAVEEHVLLRAFEPVHRRTTFRGAGVARELFHVTVSSLIDDVRLKPDETSLAETRLVHERLASERNPAVFHSAKIVGTLPVEKIFAFRDCAVNPLRSDREHHFLSRLVGERILVRSALQPRIIQYPGREYRSGSQRERHHERFHVRHLHFVFLTTFVIRFWNAVFLRNSIPQSTP